MKYFRGHLPLFITSSVIILSILVPTFLLLKELIVPVNENWEHIKVFLLRDYISNSIILIFSVGILTGIIGTYLSWMISYYDFGNNSLLFLILCLPMAIPVYIAGYVYGGIFGYGGTLERIFFNFGLSPIRLDMFSMGGAIFIFTLFLMPYVILITRAFFTRLPASYFEASTLLGKTSKQTFFKVILPLSRGAIIGGVVLVVLEVLNDYGLVKYFGITTFSTAIYKTWFGLGDINSAIRLAAILMMIVVSILSFEHLLRGRKRVSNSKANSRRWVAKKPPNKVAVVFKLICSAYILVSLVIPVTQLAYWAYQGRNNVKLDGLMSTVTDTILLATMVTLLVLLSGITIGNFNRLIRSTLSKLYGRVIVIGYSIPASIIAVAVMIFFMNLDKLFAEVYDLFGLKGNLLMGSLVMLVFALTIRFMAIGFNSIENGFNKMGNKYYEASRMLGKSGFSTFVRVDLPLLRTALLSASILTFVDVLKELPLTLILRPFNYNTLATQVFVYAGDEMIHEASVYALVIIAISAISLIMMQLILKEKKNVKGT